MRLTLNTPGVAIFDDFLDDEDRSEIWTYFQHADFSPVTQMHGAWRLDDVAPLAGENILTPGRDDAIGEPGEVPGVFPSGTALDIVLAEVLGIAEEIQPWVGDDWAKIMTRAYVYPRGSALSWHSDSSRFYQGAFIYYAQPQWNIEWGGELLVSAPPAAPATSGENPPEPIMGHRFDNRDYSDLLMNEGHGQFIMPKSNRLVVLGGLPHRVMPVSSAAGDNVRASIQGFFLREGADLGQGSAYA